MPQSLRYVLQFPGNEGTLGALLWDSLQRASFSESAFVSPFASAGGVNTLIEMCDRLGVGNRKWVVGLDGVITSPDALSAIMRDRQSTVKRAWRMGADDYLHAKVFFFCNVPAKRACVVHRLRQCYRGRAAHKHRGWRPDSCVRKERRTTYSAYPDLVERPSRISRVR